MENKNFNFKFSGIPENNEIEIPDTSQKSDRNQAPKMISLSDMKNFSEKDLEEVMKQLPPELSKFVESAGIDINQIFDQVFNSMHMIVGNMTDDQIQNMASSMGLDINLTEGSCGNCNSCESNHNEDTIDNVFPTGMPKFLFPDEFGSIPCYSSENLYEEFVGRYGTDSTLYLDDNIGIRDYLLNELTARINFDEIKNMRFINSNNNFILFYMEPKNEKDYGFYAAVIKLGENNFALYVPSYCNTFDVTEEDGEFAAVTLFNRVECPYMFNGAESDIMSFKFLSANLIEFAISYALAPKSNVLLAPKSFGTIKNIRPSISADSSMLPIGKIVSNGSVNSTLLLKDAELPLDKESYNLFMRFPTVVNEHFLRFLSGILFEVDFNNCSLLESVELKYTQDGKLYFDVGHFRDF